MMGESFAEGNREKIMKEILSLARPELLSIQPYESARSLSVQGKIFLDANESSSPPMGFPNLNRYPEPQPRLLLERFSQLYGVPTSMILIGRGSDEAIDLLVRTFCISGKDRILICPPTYGMYEVCARIQGAEVLCAPLQISKDGISLDENAILSTLSIDSGIKILFICSPNNPTGTSFQSDAIHRICEASQGRCIIVIDEAYAEFNLGITQMDFLRQYPNLVILRTLSKAWALAGARCGVAIAQPEIIALLQKIRAPYPLSTPAIEAVLNATDSENQRALQQRIQRTLGQKEKLKTELIKLRGVKRIYDSAANFLLVEFEDSARIMSFFKSRGIILRDRSKDFGLNQCIRITIGTEDETRLILNLMAEVLEEKVALDLEQES